jgi:serine/threonine protein kinase
MSGGTLYTRLHSSVGGLDATQKTIVALGVACGMEFFHSKRLIHRDLKSLNILLDEDGHPRIADFGLSRVWGDCVMTQKVGTKQWMAPEVIRGAKYDEKADVYSFGIVLWELLTQLEPFKDFNEYHLMTRVVIEGVRPRIPATCPTKLAQLIANCWDGNPENRPSFKTISEMFRSDKVSFEGTDCRIVETYMQLIRDGSPKEEPLWEIMEQSDFETFETNYGKESVIRILMNSIDDAVISAESKNRLLKILLRLPADRLSYFGTNGIERFLKQILEGNFQMTMDSIDCLMEFFAMSPAFLNESLIVHVSNWLISGTPPLKQRIIAFFMLISDEAHEHFIAVLPALFQSLQKGVWLSGLLQLFRKMLTFGDLSFEINKQSVLFCDLLESTSVDITLNLLDIIKILLDVYSPSGELIASFLSKFASLIQQPQLHRDLLFVLSQLIRNRQALSVIARLHEETPLVHLFHADPEIVAQSLKIIAVLLSNHDTCASVAVSKIQPLLASKNLTVVLLASMCLAMAPSFLNQITDHVSMFLTRAFESENELTLEGIRLGGVISQKLEGRARLLEHWSSIVDFLKSPQREIRNMAMLLCASISSTDQLNESLVLAVPFAMELLHDKECRESALVFVANMTANYEAAVLAAENIGTLVSMFCGGDVKSLVPIHRIATLPECLRHFLPSLRQFVKYCTPLLQDGIASSLLEIFDVAVQHADGKAILREAGIADVLKQHLTKLQPDDLARAHIIRLVTRIRRETR